MRRPPLPAGALERLSHYLLAFHDETFERVAEAHSIEVVKLSMEDVLAVACERVRR